MKDALFVWEEYAADFETHTDSGPGQFILRVPDTVVIPRGCITLIAGPTGSGKTSLLMALLGEMYYKPQNVGSWYSLPRKEGVAYAAQETWVLNETIQVGSLTYDVHSKI